MSEGGKWIVRTIYVVGFVDLFGVSMIIPLLPKLINNLGASRTLAGVIGSLYGALQIFSGPIMGKLSDIHGRKQLLLLTYLGPFLGYVLIGLSKSLVLLVFARTLHGILKHGLSISRAYLSDIASLQERQSVLGMFNACSSLGFIFGPLISGYLADRDPSLQLSILTGAGIIGVNFMLVAFLIPSRIQNQDLIGNTSLESVQKDDVFSWTTFRQSFSSLAIFEKISAHWWELADIITIQFLLTLSAIIFKQSFVVFLDEDLDISGTTLGQILSFNGLTSALSSATSGMVSRFYSKNSVTQIVHFTLLLAISLSCIPLAPNVVCVIVLLIPLSFSTANLRICLLTLMLQRGREKEKGARVGLANSISSISRMLAPTIVGVSQEYSVDLPAYISAALSVVAAGVASSCYCYLRPLPTSVEMDV